MSINFDQVIERRNTGCAKWQTYGEDVLPMWVADMDFRSPEPVIQALRERVEHGVFGYAAPMPELTEVICARLQRMYGWTVTPEQIVYLPGVVSAINVACRAFGQSGEGVLVQTPVYPPFLSAPGNHGLELQAVELTRVEEAHTLRYEIDYGAFESAIAPRTRLFILCQPHNPTGQEYSPEQLTRLADICLRHDVLIVSDEIHGELMLGGTRHTPTASLAPEIAAHTITLMAPSKTFNLPGLGCSFAVVPNAEWRQRMAKASEGLVPLMNALGLIAALAAYHDGDEWRAALLEYLTANRDFLVNYVADKLPRIRTTVPQATYLAWLDCRDAGISGSPYEFFLHQAKVALGDGKAFGPGGEGFVRLNFGCPRSQLVEALERMRTALDEI
jgi:cysteine-S-conjugate beta-lyase